MFDVFAIITTLTLYDFILDLFFVSRTEHCPQAHIRNAKMLKTQKAHIFFFLLNLLDGKTNLNHHKAVYSL